MYVVKHRWKVDWTNLQLKDCNNLENHQFPTLKWVKKELSKWKIKLEHEINIAEAIWVQCMHQQEYVLIDGIKWFHY